MKDYTYLIGKDVQFTSKIEELECYVEHNMRATITNIYEEEEPQNDDLHYSVWIMEVDYSKFDEFNKRFESKNYYDKHMNPCLSAREAGYYKVKEKLYLAHPEIYPFEDYVVPLDSNSSKLTELFKKSGEENYVAWLEKQLMDKETK